MYTERIPYYAFAGNEVLGTMGVDVAELLKQVGFTGDTDLAEVVGTMLK